MSNSHPRPRVDRALAIVAIAIALSGLMWPRQTAPSVQSELKPLRDEVAELRTAIKRADSSAVAPQDPQVSPAGTPTDDVTLRQVHEWVWGLEQRLVQLEQNVFSASSLVATPAPAPDIVQSRQIAVNAQASEADRLAALRTLRTADARTPDVVQAMLQMQASSADPSVRADVFRQLSGVTDPMMKPHLINGILKDNSAKVREEAAESMAPFWSDPYVQSALKSAAQNDPDEKVRMQAAETLERKGKR